MGPQLTDMRSAQSKWTSVGQQEIWITFRWKINRKWKCRHVCVCMSMCKHNKGSTTIPSKIPVLPIGDWSIFSFTFVLNFGNRCILVCISTDLNLCAHTSNHGCPTWRSIIVGFRAGIAYATVFYHPYYQRGVSFLCFVSNLFCNVSRKVFVFNEVTGNL
jgi:hypothetical protein